MLSASYLKKLWIWGVGMTQFWPVFFACLAAVGLSACSAATTSTSGAATGDPSIFAGFVTQGETTSDGVISGIPSASTTVVKSGSDGYAYSAALVDGANFTSAGGTSGESAFIATAGVVAGTELGDAPISGTASYTGAYQLTHVTIPSDQSAPTSSDYEQGSGSITLDANFNNSVITTSTTATTGSTLTVNDFGSSGNTLLMTANYRGVNGIVNGKIGTTRAVAAMAGSNSTGLFAGGFIADQ